MSNVRINLCLAFSVIALVLAGYAAMKPSARSSLAGPASNEETLLELKQQMQVYQRALARIEAGRVHQSLALSGGNVSLTTEQLKEPPVVKPEIVSFKAPDGVRIKSDANDAISVTNSDKRLTGKTIIVIAQRTDGTEESIRITLPAPDS